MSNVTNIKNITNNLVVPVSVRNGENTQQSFTVGQGTGWHGDLWIPWVNGPGDMWKSIYLDFVNKPKKLWIFQYGDRIYFADNNDFNSRHVLGGNNSIGGEKSLIIASEDDTYLD